MSFIPTVTISLSEYEDLKKVELEIKNREQVNTVLKKVSELLYSPYGKTENEAFILLKEINGLLDLNIWDKK